ncbi:MAG: SMI1/KNR4 family protein [Myxococcales bacterium]|nr:SMI1/KNR4 family protein [Myxococcales bacterium]
MGKRYFEFVEGSSSKFWEIWAEGSEVRTRYGRIGTSGQVTLKDEGSDAGAQKLLNKLIAEKTKKGYEEKTAGGAADEPAAKAAPKAEAKAAPKAEAKAVDLGPALGRIEAKAKKAGVTLRKGASEKAIAAAEKALGQSLPEDVKAFYRAHDGSDDDPAVDNRELLSLERMVGEWKVWKDLLDKGTFEKNDHGKPGKGVQKKWWIAEWIPVTYDGSGNHHVIDLAPAKGGTVGQILDFWHDDDSAQRRRQEPRRVAREGPVGRVRRGRRRGRRSRPVPPLRDGREILGHRARRGRGHHHGPLRQDRHRRPGEDQGPRQRRGGQEGVRQADRREDQQGLRGGLASPGPCETATASAADRATRARGRRSAWPSPSA